MRKLILVISLVSALGASGFAFDSAPETFNQESSDLLSRLPTGLKLKEEKPQNYKIYCDYFNLDPLGNLSYKERVSAEYTRALPENKVRWTNVRIARSQGFDDPFPEGTPQKYMDGFTYSTSVPGELFKEQFFTGFPPTEPKTKNLVWDMLMLEEFSWDYFDKLRLNEPYAIQNKPEDVPLAGSGTFQNRQIQLTWLGISKLHGETCALIQYQAINNKFSTSMGTLKFEGRSHYWGEIWVSLQDKQIEFATLLEDVLVQFTLPGQTGKQISNVFRKCAFEKTAG